MSSLRSADSSDQWSAERAGDWMRSDIDWTVKYLTSDYARSSPFTIASRLSRTSEHLLPPSTYEEVTRSSYYEAPVVAAAMRTTEGDLDSDFSRNKRTVKSPNLNHSTLPVHFSSSVDDNVIDDVTMTSYRDTMPRRMYNNYDIDMSTSNDRANYHPTVTVLPPTEHKRQLSSTSYSSQLAEPKSVKLPGVSLARRKIRRIICRSKGDPNYFDM